MVDDLHGSVLLDPKFPQDDVVHTTHWICPCVRFFMSGRNTQKYPRKFDILTYLLSCGELHEKHLQRLTQLIPDKSNKGQRQSVSEADVAK